MFFASVVVWNVLIAVSLVGTIVVGHRPHVPTETTRVVIGVLLDVWLVGNAVILGCGYLLRRHMRRQS